MFASRARNHGTKLFYVYAYLRSRTTDYGLAGSPYYIGKGFGKRAFAQSCHSVPLPRDAQHISILSADMSESDAFQLEMLLIHLYGRIDLGRGSLRNLTDGGDGPSGWIASERTRKTMSAAARERWAALTHDEKHKLSEAKRRGWAKLTEKERLQIAADRSERWKLKPDDEKRRRGTKQSESHKLRWTALGDEVRRRISETQRRRYSLLPDVKKDQQRERLGAARTRYLANRNDDEKKQASRAKSIWHTTRTGPQKENFSESMIKWHQSLTMQEKFNRSKAISQKASEKWSTRTESQIEDWVQARNAGWARLTDDEKIRWKSRIGRAHKARIAALSEDAKSARNRQLSDALKKRWANTPKRTRCPQGHPYDEENKYVDPRGGWHCKMCVKASKKRSALKKSAPSRESTEVR